ncbi:MAG: UPF0175 family protein [Chloroflexi bacterium]|nr:UPF0175 family protein [Chloroflexota bacterium]
MPLTTSDLSTHNVIVQVSLPSELLAESGVSRQEASVELLRAYILSLYRRDRLSSGKAASLLNVSRLTFLRLLGEEGIPYLDYTTDELDAEMAVASQWPQA